jgi:hypothetical protein
MKLMSGSRGWPRRANRIAAARSPWRWRSALGAVSLGVIALGIVVLGLVATDAGSGEAVSLTISGEIAPASQTPGLEPAFLTLINVTDAPRIARVDGADGSLGSRVEFLPAAGVRTIEMHEAFEPRSYQLSCAGCAGVSFSLAAGQRIIVFVVEPGDPLSARTDLRIVNQSGARQSGVVRTGSTFGEGRTVVRYDLSDGEDVVVGVRLNPRTFLDLHVTCGACLPHRIRVYNGADLEIPLR